MKDYIYIIGGIAYLAYTFYSASQKNKKKQESARPQPYAETEDEVEATEPLLKKEPVSSVFNEILGLQNFDLNVEEELYGKVEEDVIDVVPKEEGVRTTKVNTQQSIQAETIEEMAIQEDEEEEALDYEFNLRDAIISSEILNPPYINR